MFSPPQQLLPVAVHVAHQSWPTTKSAQNMVPCANQYSGHAHLRRQQGGHDLRSCGKHAAPAYCGAADKLAMAADDQTASPPLVDG